jgi:hypothetical protein
MDVVFVVDDTGSMTGSIASVKAGLGTIITTANTASGGQAKFGLIGLKGAGGGDAIVVRQPLTDNTATITTAVSDLAAWGGAGEPEISDEALKYAINRTTACTMPLQALGTYREGCLKIVVLVTDARPGGCNDVFTLGVDDVNALEVAGLGSANGVKISSVLVNDGTNVDTERPIMSAYAATTGGVFSEVPATGEGTGEAINELIAKCGTSSKTCPLSQGYWKNHPEDWPVDFLVIGGRVYTKAELLTILLMPTQGNATLILMKQLIAAQLNVSNGAIVPPLIGDVIAGANAWMAGKDILTYVVRTNTAEGKILTKKASWLDEYNNRLWTPDCESKY